MNKEILDFIANACFYGNYCYIDEKGNRLEKPRAIGHKMEVLLEAIMEQRTLHIERLAKAKDPRVLGKSCSEVVSTWTFSTEDMQTLMNEWKLDVEKWMHPAPVEIH